MNKRMTLLSANGILATHEDANAFELDLVTMCKKNPTATMIIFDAQVKGETAWFEIATVYVTAL